MIIYWDTNSKAQISGYFKHFFGSTETPALPNAAIWLFAPDVSLMIWQDNTLARASGYPLGRIAKTTATPAAGVILYARSKHRFVFSRVHGRVN